MNIQIWTKKIPIINKKGINVEHNILNEIKLQKIASTYGFTPKILDVVKTEGEYHISMEHIEEECLANKYGEEPEDIPKQYWNQIKSILNVLFDREGIEYIDITPYNFIEKDNKLYLIDFGHAFLTPKLNPKKLIPTNWFLRDFLDRTKQVWEFNPDFR